MSNLRDANQGRIQNCGEGKAGIRLASYNLFSNLGVKHNQYFRVSTQNKQMSLVNNYLRTINIWTA